MVLERKSPDPFLLVITPILLFLVFWGLGNQYLWYDETETAVLARSVLTYGYPRALIGDFLVSTDEKYGALAAWIAQPWLQNYICAGSFLLFGESNASARILFAVFGFLSFYLLYIFSHRLFNDHLISRISVFIAATSVPFLLHLRQCRYYSLVVFFTLALLISYLGFLERRKYSALFFVISSFLLFHSNFGCLIPTLIALAVHFFLIEKNRALIFDFLKLYAWVFLVTLPGAFLYKIWIQVAERQSDSILRNMKFYLSKVNSYFFPYRFLFIELLLILAFKRRVNLFLNYEYKKPLLLLFLIIFINFGFISLADYNSARYVIHIAGLFFIIEAVIIKAILKWKKLVGVILLLAISFTDLLNVSLFPAVLKPVIPFVIDAKKLAVDRKLINDRWDSRISKELKRMSDKASVKTYFFDYLYEITHDYDGPIEGVVKYLNRNAKKGDIIKTHVYNATSLFFYTGLNIETDFSKETYPEWFFLRDYWTEDEFYDSEYFRKIGKSYDRIELDYPDILWENRPDDMSFHYFKTAPLKKRISLYRKKKK